DGSAWRDTKVSIDDLKLYKEDSKLILRDSGAGLCVPARNRFRLCLKTNYEYTKYNPDADVSEKITREKIIVPFAIMVRDGVPPKPVTGYSAQNVYHAKDALLLTWNKNEEKDVTMYNLYLSDDLTNFGGPTTGFRDLMNYKTINSLESYIEYHFIDYNNPVCNVQEDNGALYCRFEYGAIDKDGNSVQIELAKEKLYYIIDANKFLYIIDGTDSMYGLTNNFERHIAITAIDIDGNEIDNIADNERITQGENLLSITPQDLLEPGFADINHYGLDYSGGLTLSWSSVVLYIDGSSMVDYPEYYVYVMQGICDGNVLSEIPESSIPEAATSGLDAWISLSQSSDGTTIDYCIYVVPRLNGLGFMQGFARQVSVSGTAETIT
ncbi:MAG: hypothetical protein ACP5OA_04365, partial [Candidatus Woesearchaeota archaeon]